MFESRDRPCLRDVACDLDYNAERTPKGRWRALGYRWGLRRPGVLPACGTRSHVRNGLLVQTLALVCVPERLAHDPPNNTRTEVIRVVEPVHRSHHLLAGQTRILKVRELLAARVGDGFRGEESVG